MDDETRVDVTSDEFRDDSSAALGLGHHATKARSGGANKFFEQEEREHRRLQTEEMAKQGVSDPTKVRPTNHGAYDVDEGHERRKAADEEYLGDSIQNLAGSTRRVHAGGGGGNVTKIVKTPVTETCPDCLGTCVTSSVELSEVRENPLCKRCKGAGTIVTGWKQEQVQLMGAKSVGGGGGSGGKMKRGKRGGGAATNGEILASYGADGKAYVHTIEPEARSERFEGRMSEATAEGILAFQEQTGVNLSGIAAAVARMQESNDPNVRLALEMLVSQVPVRGGTSKAS